MTRTDDASESCTQFEEAIEAIDVRTEEEPHAAATPGRRGVLYAMWKAVAKLMKRGDS